MNKLQFEVFQVDLNPTIGSEQKGIWPCVVVSHDDVNQFLNTVVIAPLTTTIKSYPTRVDFKLNFPSQIMLDQIRTVDKKRLIKPMGKLDRKTALIVTETLRELFAI